MEEFIIEVDGFRKSKLEEWYKTRVLAFTMAKPYLKDKNITMEQFWPLPGDKKTGKAARKRLNQMTPEERKERIKAIAAHLNGITTNN
jgi:hypothetical protein